MKQRAFQVAALVILSIGGVAIGKSAARFLLPAPPSAAIETEVNAPAMLLGQDHSGAQVSVQITSRTKPLAIFALSVDCPYCLRNLPNWRDVARAVTGEDTTVEVLVLSISSPERTTAYLEANRLPANVIYVDARELRTLGLPGVPGTVAVTPGDLMVRKWVGVLEASDVSKITAWAQQFATRSAPDSGTP